MNGSMNGPLPPLGGSTVWAMGGTLDGPITPPSASLDTTLPLGWAITPGNSTMAPSAGPAIGVLPDSQGLQQTVAQNEAAAAQAIAAADAIRNQQAMVGLGMLPNSAAPGGDADALIAQAANAKRASRAGQQLLAVRNSNLLPGSISDAQALAGLNSPAQQSAIDFYSLSAPSIRAQVELATLRK